MKNLIFIIKVRFLNTVCLLLCIGLGGCLAPQKDEELVQGGSRKTSSMGGSLKSNNGGTGNPVVNVSPTYSSLNANIFSVKCLGCHNGNVGTSQPNFSTYAALMAGRGIVARSPDLSPIYLRTLDGSMPPSYSQFSPLQPSEVSVLRAWILAGALNDGTSGGGNTPMPTAAPTPTPVVSNPSNQSTSGTIGIRNFEQLRDSMAVVTGISLGSNLNGAADPQSNITSFYNTFRAQLPLLGNVNEMTPSMLLVVADLASLFCQQAINREKILPLNDSQRILFTDIDFTKNQTFLTAAIRQNQINRFASSFWRRPATASEITNLSAAMDESMMGRANSTTELQNALLITCTAALSSTDFIKN